MQSVIGVGLLVFGTPTFMLFGYSFQETLGMVLPPSILISFFQVIESPASVRGYRREFNLYCLPFVLGGLLLTLTITENVNLRYPVGVMLVVSGLIRFSEKLESLFRSAVKQHRKLYQIFMGCIHGLTNMGGGLLTLFSSSIHKNDKFNTRSGIAYGYLVMGEKFWKVGDQPAVAS